MPQRIKNSWEMSIGEAAKALGMSPYDMKCKMRHGELKIGFATLTEGRSRFHYTIYRKLVKEEQERLGIPQYR